MDVELLRPGNVPISPNTVLWFEFLLNPDLLEEHLRKPNPDPVPSDLLIKFLTLSVEPSAEEAPEKTRNFKCSKRHLSMKILALKIVAHWKWDLEMIETKLPLQLQYVLLKDLLCLANVDIDQSLAAPMVHQNLDYEQLRDEQIFAIALCHRWTLHIIVNSPMVSKNILCSMTTNVESADEIMSKIMDDEGKSEIILRKIVALQRSYIICPTFHNIFPPTEDADLKQDWENGLRIPAPQFYCQIFYDLGTYKVYRELNTEATQYFSQCKNLYDQLKCDEDFGKTGFFKIKENSLKGFCYACGVTSDNNRNLTLKFYSAIRNNYTDVINILQADNLKREIPLSYRDSLELDLASYLTSGKFTASKDLLFQIQTLNVVCRVLEGASYPSVYDYAGKLNACRKGNIILIKALKLLVSNATSTEKLKIRLFLLTLFDKCDSSLVRNVMGDQELSALFSDTELREARTRFDDDSNIPDLSEMEEHQEKKMKLIGSSQLELSMLEHQIIKTYDPRKLKELIMKFTTIDQRRPITDIYNKWEKYFQCEMKEKEKHFQYKMKDNERHIQCDKYHVIAEIIPRLPNEFCQQYWYCALAKVKELLELRKFDLARDFITAAGEDVNKHQFSQLLSWEKLYVDLIELQVMWPASRSKYGSLATSCRSCLNSWQQRYDQNFRGNSNLPPRDQIGEQCVITLLNVDRDYLANYNFSNKLQYLKLFSALSAACKKSSPEAWHLILPAFSSSNLQKRQAVQFSDRESNTVTYLVSKVALVKFFLKLRDTKVINVVLSLLSRLHNVLRDELSLELYFMYTQVWPSNVPNSSAYHPDSVIDVIAEVLDEILQYEPNNCDWLRLSGDVNYVKEHYSTALKRYFEALVAVSDYFVKAFPKNAADDFMFKRMVRCCSMLQCYSQAAVLCQFLEEVDYTTAFKCLSETMSADATDCYYECIWDVNILEFLIALHTKRNEHCKKQKVIDAIGLLELNSNNNDEIKREAAKVRKTKFLRAMAKQYIIY